MRIETEHFIASSRGTRYTFTDAAGDLVTMSEDEVAAIERSGKSGTVQQYALEPGQYTHRTGGTLRMKLGAFDDRPGKTEPKPVAAPIVGKVAKEKAVKAVLSAIHWVTPVNVKGTMIVKSVCGMPRGAVRIGLHGAKFRSYTHHRDVCRACAEAYKINHR